MATPVNSRDVYLQASSNRVLDTALTREEKPSYINLYAQILTKQPILNQSADKYGIVTEKTTYNNAITALTTYLATLTVPVLWNVLTNFTNINRATFDDKFGDVLAAEQALELLTTNKYGLTTTIIYAYKRATALPTDKPGNVTYDFTTASITTPSGDALANGWTKTIPSGSDQLYACLATASNTTTTDSILNAEWSSAVLYGTSSLNTASIYIYTRTSGGSPLMFTGDTTYTFNPPSLSGLSLGWTTSIPSSTTGSGYLWVSTATAVSSTNTDTIPSTEYAAPRLLSVDGISVSLSATSQSFTYNGVDEAVPSSQTITFTATVLNLTGTPSFICTLYNNSGGSLGPVTLGGSGITRTLTNAQFSTAAYAVITVSLGAFNDTMTIVRLTDGEPNLVGYLTNESHTVSANSDGSSPVFTGASGTFKVFLGLTDVTNLATFSVVGSPEVTTSAPATGTGAYSVTAAGTWPSANTVTSVTYRATYNSMNLDKVFSLSKAKAGLSAPLLFLSSTAQSFTYDGVGAASPASQTISFTANLQNVTGTATFVATKYNVSGGSLGTTAMGGSGNTRTLSNIQFDVAHYVIVTATLGSLTDTMTIVKLVNGSPNLVGYLTNEAHTIPSSSAGVPTSFSGATGTFKVFLGLTDVTNLATFSVVGSPEVTTSAPTAGTGAYSVTAVGSWANSSNTTSVTYRATYNSVTVDKVLSLTKSLSGPQGTPGSPGPEGDRGDPGTDGASYRTAYIASSVTSAAGSYTPDSGSTFTPTPGNASPNNWGLTGTWQTSPMSLSAGQFMYQSDGIYNPATGQTTWSTPYWSSLKVGSLDAITVSTGFLAVTGYITAGTADISGTTMTGSGFKMYVGGNFVIGNASGNINYNGSQLTLNGPVVSSGSFSSPSITSASISSASISGGTITAGTFYSSASNPRLSINEGGNNKILIYNSSGTAVTDIGGSGGTVFISGIAGSQPGVYSTINSAAGSVVGTNTGTGAGGEFTATAGNRGIRVSGKLNTISKTGDDGIAEMNSVVPLTTATFTLGKSTLRWNGIYSTVAVDVSSDARTKDNIQDSDLGLPFIMKLRSVKYTIKVSEHKVVPDTEFVGPPSEIMGPATKIEEVSGSRPHYGLISQEVKQALGDKDAAFWCLADKNDPDSQQSLRYEELISPMIKAIQEMYKELQAVKEELNILKQS